MFIENNIWKEIKKERKKEKPSYYAIIPANVRYDERLSANSKLLYGEITALTNEKGYCWAGDVYFADLYNVGKSTIQNWLRSLEQNGYITRGVVYEEGTKKIIQRQIKLVVHPIPNNEHTLYQKNGIPYTKKMVYPIPNNWRDNNTSNNTINNIPPIVPQNEILTETEIMFNQFWKSYPNKKAKQVAYKSFTKLTLSEKLFNEIMDKLELFKKTKQWSDPKYIPYPSTWLNQKRWEDELTDKDFRKITTKDLDIDISDF
jgi:DNA-binding transcriptional ArsR family regulator